MSSFRFILLFGPVKSLEHGLIEHLGRGIPENYFPWRKRKFLRRLAVQLISFVRKLTHLLGDFLK